MKNKKPLCTYCKGFWGPVENQIEGKPYCNHCATKEVKMTFTEFDKFMQYVIDKHILEVMCSKSAEYSRGDDKLHNFKRAGELDNISPIEALRGMHLKHRVSVQDMLDDLLNPERIEHTQELWQEKLSDTINYYFLLWALLMEKYGWEAV
jgi:hypothetical protein